MSDDIPIQSGIVSRITYDVASWVHSMPGGLYEKILHSVLPLGLFWLFAGLAIMPAGESLSPSHAYSYVLLPTLGLPALLLIIRRPGSVKDIVGHPLMRWVCLLLLWSAISLVWTRANHAADWVGRILGVFVFFYAWKQVTNYAGKRIRVLLVLWALVFTATALVAFVTFRAHLMDDGYRIMAFGVLRNPNVAAAAMAIVTILLYAFPVQQVWQRATRVLMVTILVVFVGLTQSRGVWGALYAAMWVLVLCSRSKYRPWLILCLVAAAVAAVTVLMPEMSARSASHRPGIILSDIQMFLQHPWHGVGQGSDIRPVADGMTFWHAHNMFGQLAIQLGGVGLFLWLVPWITLAWYAWLCRMYPLGRAVLALWVFTTIESQVGLPHLIDSPRVEWMAAWLPIAMGCSLPQRTM